MEYDGDSQLEAFKVYRKYVRAQKRKFIRAQQHVMTEELKREPQLFWQRLRPQRLQTELDALELGEYVRTLYFFPEVDAMPAPVGDIGPRTIEGNRTEDHARFWCGGAELLGAKAMALWSLAMEMWNLAMTMWSAAMAIDQDE
ncbi:hypothetical protein R1sor_018022 [Riccia sorocarpa]|uniref:Uncharacterized protein n=1 Tax=Riccia sorocarpa TaxID=122646 RepID=A0ABD3IC31_9MARC